MHTFYLASVYLPSRYSNKLINSPNQTLCESQPTVTALNITGHEQRLTYCDESIRLTISPIARYLPNRVLLAFDVVQDDQAVNTVNSVNTVNQMIEWQTCPTLRDCNATRAVIQWLDVRVEIERFRVRTPPGALLISFSKKFTCDCITSSRCKLVPTRVVYLCCAICRLHNQRRIILPREIDR
ncbi:hypothetical protein ACF0H5_005789 [Mactra antiquata]